MRIVFDVLGSPERSGGMRLHGSELIGAWLENFPEDEVTIVGPQWAATEFGRDLVEKWPNERVATRAFGQLFVSPIVAARKHADALVSLSPIVSPLARTVRACFQHDWRHKLNPEEFPRAQRAYRRLWQLSARRAHLNLCISTKAARETLQYAPGAKVTIVENGRDHARRWTLSPRTEASRGIVTFGHHNNKRPDLVIRALPAVRKALGGDVTLTVLGARGNFAEELRAIARAAAVEDVVRLPGFVSDTEYQSIVSQAGVVVMPSTDEGFGLPVAEAQYLGIPAVVTRDSGMVEIFGDSVVAADPNPAALAQAISVAFAGPAVADEARQYLPSWTSAAQRLRLEIKTLIQGP